MSAITTIIPTFRRPASLERAVRSVLDQTYRDCVVCVYDNASGDETERIVSALAAQDARVRYERHPANMGAFENFLYGMARVATPFFSFLSDDDALLPEFYAAAHAAFERFPAAMLFAGQTMEVDEAGDVRFAPLALWPREGLYEPPEGMLRMLDNRHPTMTGVLFRREVIERVGLLDRETGICSDLDYELRIAGRFPMIVSFTPCALWTSHAASASTGQDASVAPRFERMIHNVETMPDLADDVRGDVVRRLRRQLQLKLLEISVKAQVHGDAGASRDAARALGERNGMLAGALSAMSWTCEHVPGAQGVLRGLEALRLRARARSAQRHLERLSATGRRSGAVASAAAPRPQ